MKPRSQIALFIAAVLLAALMLAQDGRAGDCRGEKPTKADPTETRCQIAVFQFDDGTAGHYTHAFRILEKHKLKGSFGVVTGVLDRRGRLTKAQLVEMDKAGHEIHDHTLYHDAAFWGDVEKRAEWPRRIEQSLTILRGLGIETRGWNQPGGKGQKWTEPLRLALSEHYDYAAGRVALRGEQQCNVHWHLKDDPLSLGRGGIASWGHNGGEGDPAKELECVKTKMADGVQQGVVAIPLWHRVGDEDRTAWALEEVCKFVRRHDIKVMLMADAVRAIQDPRKHFDRHVEQMPNPTLAGDIDGNGRPDGYSGCSYGPAGNESPGGGRPARCSRRTSTWIYGPEPGRTRLCLSIRSADDSPRTITPLLTFVEVDDKYGYHWRQKWTSKPISAGPKWSRHCVSLLVDEDVDRVKIEFDVKPPGEFYLGSASWRLVD